MGKIHKKKESKVVSVKFIMLFADNTFITEDYLLEADNEKLTFWQFNDLLQQFLHKNSIGYEVYMCWSKTKENNKLILLKEDFIATLEEIIGSEEEKTMRIVVQSYTKFANKKLEDDFNKLRSEIEELQNTLPNYVSVDVLNRIKESQTKEGKTMETISNQIKKEFNFLVNELDICVLFSEPLIFDEQTYKEVPAVNYRSEINRLKLTLKNSFRPFVTFKCEIATKENLRESIFYNCPKILHIICHGFETGVLYFEEDSKNDIGLLKCVTPEEIQNILERLKEKLPNVVFINSCHSEKIGIVFYNMGVKNVIMINNEDTIDDLAAQIFSETFYGNIFRGLTVENSFINAKEAVKNKSNKRLCCCYHNGKKPHKENCRWVNIILKKNSSFEAHKTYHIPSEKCQCDERNINKHNINCVWALETLFEINEEFRIKENENIVRNPSLIELSDYAKTGLPICCCIELRKRIEITESLHTEAEKFEMLSRGTERLFKEERSGDETIEFKDASAPKLQFKGDNIKKEIQGREKELCKLIRAIKNNNCWVQIVRGEIGVGKTTFVRKAATYLEERTVVQKVKYVNLLEVEDYDMFNFEFKQQSRLTTEEFPLCDKSEEILLVLDNADNCVKKISEQLRILKELFPLLKCIIVLNTHIVSDENLRNLFLTVELETTELSQLNENAMAKILFHKISNFLDLSVNVHKLALFISPFKILSTFAGIEKLEQAVIKNNKKITLIELEDFLKSFDDNNVEMETVKALQFLENKEKRCYCFLIFLAQFSKGLNEKELEFISLKRETLYSNIDIFPLPIGKDWPSLVYKLFNYDDYKKEFLSNLPLRKIKSTNELSSLPCFERNESRWLERKDESISVKSKFRNFFSKQKNNIYIKKMGDMFIVFFYKMLKSYVELKQKETSICEKLVFYSALSNTGIFKQSKNEEAIVMTQKDIDEEKIKSLEKFVAEHILDLWQIYNVNWIEKNVNEVSKEKNNKENLCAQLLQLAILIPTVLKLCNKTDLIDSNVSFALNNSETLINNVKIFLDFSSVLKAFLKIQLMKVRKIDFLQNDSSIFEFEFPKLHRENLSLNDFEVINCKWLSEQRYLKIMRIWFLIKENESNISYIEKKIIQAIDLAKEFYAEIEREKLHHKFSVVIGLILSFSLTLRSEKIKIYFIKESFISTEIIKRIKEAVEYFTKPEPLNLKLLAKICLINIIYNSPKENNVEKREKFIVKKDVTDCIEEYEDHEFDLRSDIYLQKLISVFRKTYSNYISKETICYFCSVPLFNDESIENCCNEKLKHTLKYEIERILKNKNKEIYYHFKTLTLENLKSSIKNPINKEKHTLTIIETDWIVKDDNTFMVCENGEMRSDLIHFNEHSFNRFYDLQADCILFLGNNADVAANILIRSKYINASIFYLTYQSHENSRLFLLSQEIFEQDEFFNFNRIFIEASKKRLNIFFNNIIEETSQEFSNLTNLDLFVKDNLSQKKQLEIFKYIGKFRDVSSYKEIPNNLLLFEDKQRKTDCFDVRHKEIQQIFTIFFDQFFLINLHGKLGSGKTTLLIEIGMLALEKKIFFEGIYVLTKEEIAKKENNIERCIRSNRLISEKECNLNMLLIIDDFDEIQLNINNVIFLKKLLTSKCKIITTTKVEIKKFMRREPLLKDESELFKELKITSNLTKN